jgi:hypothetical protein
MRWVRHAACMGELRNLYKILIGKPEGKRPLRKPRHRWEGNIKMYLREIMLEGVDWIDLALDREHYWALVNTAVNLQIP